QLRLLFDEVRAHQPSIIFFFDEIDGFTPTSSSKQDQIHASIVATLLAFMDGMAGSGLVIVIGTTNRLDALRVDPAPSRVIRPRLYLGLPSAEAREHIEHYDAWVEGVRRRAGYASRARGLATLTKGYGGAGLRV
ncbi:hypothetical protein B0H11DRAFT_1689934, partial [Mycena galericulata]